MKFHPCCGLISLRSAIKIAALIDLGLSIALFKIAFFALILIIPIKLSTEVEVIELGDEKVTNNDFIVIGIGLTLTVISCGLAVFLYFAAEKKNANHCKIWMGTTGALLTLDAFLTWPLLSQIHISDVFIFGIIYAFAVYQFWLVFEFIEELTGDVNRRKRTNNHTNNHLNNRGLVVCETDTAISDV